MIRCWLIVLALWLTGCATSTTNIKIMTLKDDDPQFVVERDTSFRVINWWRVSYEEVQKACNKYVDYRDGRQFLGCAVYSGKTCNVYTTTTVTHQLLGHEIRHCFYGNFHDE